MHVRVTTAERRRIQASLCVYVLHFVCVCAFILQESVYNKHELLVQSFQCSSKRQGNIVQLHYGSSRRQINGYIIDTSITEEMQ